MQTLAKLLPDDVMNDFPKAICNPHLEFTDDVESLPILNGQTGDVLFKSSTPGARRISRQRLRKVLGEGIRIEWGKKLARISPTDLSMQLEFEDGQICDADYVLGADGASSKMRELLLGTEASQPAMSGFMFATAMARYGDEEKTNLIVKTHPVAALMMGSGVVGGCGGKLSARYLWYRVVSYS